MMGGSYRELIGGDASHHILFCDMAGYDWAALHSTIARVLYQHSITKPGVPIVRSARSCSRCISSIVKALRGIRQRVL